jgi:hypothetical protein
VRGKALQGCRRSTKKTDPTSRQRGRPRQDTSNCQTENKNLSMSCKWEPDTKTDWPTDRRSQNSLNLGSETVIATAPDSTNLDKRRQFQKLGRALSVAVSVGEGQFWNPEGACLPLETGTGGLVWDSRRRGLSACSELQNVWIGDRAGLQIVINYCKRSVQSKLPRLTSH